MRRGGAPDGPCDVHASPPLCAVVLWPCACILGSPDWVRGRGVRLGASSPVERTVTPSPGASPHGLRAFATVTRERTAHHLLFPLCVARIGCGGCLPTLRRQGCPLVFHTIAFVMCVGAGGHPGATRKDRAYTRGPHHKIPGVTSPCNGVLQAKN